MRSLARVGLRSRQSDEPSSVDRLRIRRGLVAMMGVAGAFVLLAALVVGGALTRFDQYAVDHWMPAIDPTDMGHVPLVSIRQLYPQPHLARPVDAICDLWTYPASALVSALVVAALSLVLVRRGRQRTALAFAVAWILANAAEVFGKRALERPGLTVPGRGSLGFFQNSFPSGHATRAVVTAALLAIVWPRLMVPALVWAVGVMPALVAFGAHTPSDVIGGALLGLLALLAVDIWLHANAASGRAGTRSQPRDAPGPRASRMPP
jgi:membrane-associated phospholipid phosphatase